MVTVVHGDPPRVGDVVDVTVDRPAVGGDGIGRLDDGRVIFVAGALPGERVRACLTELRRDFARAEASEVVVAVPGRIAPVCAEVARGCGGCDLAYASGDLQREMKRAMVVDSLIRLGRVDSPEVVAGPMLAPAGFRTTVRAAVVKGRAGFRKSGSHDVLAVEGCRVAHPLLEELLTDGWFGSADEVILRLGAATGERMALVSPDTSGVELPTDVSVVGADEVHSGETAWVHEQVGGRTFRISAGSFFQSRPDGAEALVEAVRKAAGELVRRPGQAVDAYCGVGLFASCLASGLDVPVDQARRFVAVERNASSVSHARHNLDDRHARVIRARVDDLRDVDADLVVADPSRAGLDRAGAEALSATGAQRLVLVSCDAASLGRDARLLAGHGFGFVSAEMVDMFPDTHHVEVVSRFDR